MLYSVFKCDATFLTFLRPEGQLLTAKKQKLFCGVFGLQKEGNDVIMFHPLPSSPRLCCRKELSLQGHLQRYPSQLKEERLLPLFCILVF